MQADEFNLKTITDTVITNFVQLEISHCKSNNVKVTLKNTTEVDCNGVECSGYFCTDPNPELVVAMGKHPSDWLATFVHETCHKDQWVEQSPVWNKKIKEYFDAADIFDMWLNNAVELTKNQLNDVLEQVMMVEIDCEKRSIEKIKKYNLPIDVIEYTQKANSYIYYHHAIAYKRQWGAKTAPYENPNVWTKMPLDFNQNYSKINRKMLNLYLKHCW